MADKRPERKDYGKLKIAARKLHGFGTSHRDIADELGISAPTIQNWIKKEKWVKGDLIAKSMQKEEETILKVAEKRGLTKAKVIDKILEFQDAQKKVKLNLVSDDKQDMDATEGKGLIETETEPDYKVQVEGNKQAIDILGLKTENINVTDSEDSILARVRKKMTEEKNGKD